MRNRLLDSEEADREAMTCAVCLDIYFSPYSCHPCDHVFCEPCLRMLTKNRPTNTPCPLCRTIISHTSFHQGNWPDSPLYREEILLLIATFSCINRVQPHFKDFVP